MSCYHPMVLIKTLNMTDPEQRKIAEILRMRHKGEGHSTSTFLIPRDLALGEGLKLRDENAILVPCGHCIGCRLDYARQWAERCIHEADKHENNYFLTLTYDDDHLPKNKKDLPAFFGDEISDFMKVLRQYWKRKFNYDGIRFFGCAEYGEHAGQRLINPHLHILLFNCPIPDLQERHPVKVDGVLKWIKQFSDTGEQLLFSPAIHQVWQKKGSAQIGQVTFESASYVARYIMKKQYGLDAKVYRDLDMAPPYIRMSRRPGIGADWYKENLSEIYQYDKVVVHRGNMSFFQNPGRYCDNLLKDLDPQRFYELKEKRHRGFYDSVDCKVYETVDVASNLLKAEEEKKRSAKLLKRKL